MIKGIIFDLGNTLLHFTCNDEIVSRAGAEAMAEWYFKKKRIKLDQSTLVEAFLAQRRADQAKAAETDLEITAQESLRQALQTIEASERAASLVEAAVKVFFEPEETGCWERYPGTEATLKTLAGQGYRLGLYSNATDDALVQRLVNQHKLRPWLSPAFSSAGWKWRKPRRELFELIAGRWQLPPDQIVMVGDTLNADILGAQNAGMRGILVTMNESASNVDHRHIKPDAVAETLPQLPDIVAQM